MLFERNIVPNLSRRLVLGLGAACAVAGSSSLARAEAATDQATAFMTGMIKELTGLVNSSAANADKAAGLQKIIDKAVDVNGIGRFCLGRFWRTASPDEQKQYIELFHKVLLKNITSKVAITGLVDVWAPSGSWFVLPLGMALATPPGSRWALSSAMLSVSQSALPSGAPSLR